jgi:hypothetical protein
VLNGETVLVDKPELERIVLQGRDLERCSAALDECNAAAMPEIVSPAPSRRWRLAAAVAAAFLTGAAVGHGVPSGPVGLP